MCYQIYLSTVRAAWKTVLCAPSWSVLVSHWYSLILYQCTTYALCFAVVCIRNIRVRSRALVFYVVSLLILLSVVCKMY